MEMAVLIGSGTLASMLIFVLIMISLGFLMVVIIVFILSSFRVNRYIFSLSINTEPGEAKVSMRQSKG